MRKVAIAAAVAFIALHADAGLLVARDDGSRVKIEGGRFRIDKAPPKDSPIVCDGVISGTPVICLNSELHTWFESDAREWMMSSHRLGLTFRARVRKVKIASHDEKTNDVILGHVTEKHVITGTYDIIDQQDVRQSVAMTVVVWTAPDLATPIPTGVRTGAAEVDDALAKIFASFQGMVVKQTLNASDTYEGGKPFTDSASWTVQSIETKTFPPSMFEVPKGYRHEAPKYGMAVK